MKIRLGDIANGVEIGSNFNPEIKKVSRKIDLIKDSLVSVVVMILGILFFLLVWYIGLILIGLAFVIFFVSLKHKKRLDRVMKMRQELKDSPSLDEEVGSIFTDLDSGKGKNRQGFREEKENVMLLTEKRIIFMDIPRIGFQNIENGEVLHSIGKAINYDSLRKKVLEELENKGVRNMIKEYTAYTMNYNEISEVKVNLFFSTATFIYRGNKFRYFIRRDQMEGFRQIFANYL